MSWVTLGDEADVLDYKDLMFLRKYLILIQKGMRSHKRLKVRDSVVRSVLCKGNSGSFVVDSLESEGRKTAVTSAAGII